MIFSIIVPIYNEDFNDFKALLNSINKNNFAKYEIIIVDDSKYKNKNYFKQHALKFNTNYFHNKTKLGLSMSCNFGLMKAKGKYVIFLNCDNVIQKDFLQKAYKKLYKNNIDTMMLYNRVLNYKNKFGQFVQSQSRKNILNGNRLKKLLSFNFLSYTEGFIVKRSLLKISGGFFDHKKNYFRAGEDFIFANELRKMGNLKSIIDFTLNVSHTVPSELKTFYYNRYIRGYGTPQMRYYYYKNKLLHCNLFFISKNIIKIIFILLFPLYILTNFNFYKKFVNKNFLSIRDFFLIKLIEDIAIIHGELMSILKINFFFRDKNLINLKDVKNI